MRRRLFVAVVVFLALLLAFSDVILQMLFEKILAG